ncbi:hypothetical protein Tco_1279830 [Tanacetum coccineum]
MTKSREEVYFSNTSKTANVSNTVSKPISIRDDEFSDDTPSLSVERKFLNEAKDTIVTLQRVAKSRTSLNVNNWSFSVHQEIHKIFKDEIAAIVNQVYVSVIHFEKEFLKEAAKFVRDFKSLAKEADESLDKITAQTKIKTDSLQEKPNDTIYESAKLREQLHTKFSEQNDAMKGVESTVKTRRPQHRSNTKNDRKHMSSECNNIKLAIQNDKSEVVFAYCKKCLITANHDVCVFNYVNDMNSRDNNQSANVSNNAHQKKHKAKVKNSKKLGSEERLASPRPSKPRTYLRWSPTGRSFDLSRKIIESIDFECKSDTSVYDDASAPNP